jgi:hypothetical protein
MKSRYGLSFWVCIFCFTILIAIRILSLNADSKAVKVTTWDALGYYMYLPGSFIYHDLKELKWYPAIDSTYHLTGSFYQAGHYKNGNYVFKYLSGTAITYSPFFFIAHLLAPCLGYAADGFSLPYQLAICIASLLYTFLALLVLRKVLLTFFSDTVTAITLLLVALATNLPQYAAVDCGMTHSYLFALYSFQLWVTMQWYRQPEMKWAFAGGLLIGLAAITRPTDAVMLLIPLLWNEPNKAAAKLKWQFVWNHKWHISMAGLGIFIGILPQLIYWKYITGNWVYDVGSKWFFLNPFWRVLIGWTNGWLIYTPIVVFFIVGLFIMKDKPFKKSVIVFFVINTWIIISWSDWRYGGTYSCRALVQSYPVLALPFASAVAGCISNRWRYFFTILWVYLLVVNLFQIYQYDTGIIHYNRMNRLYYQAIYLKAHPSPLDYSLLDTDEQLNDESNYKRHVLFILRDTALILQPGEHTIDAFYLSQYCTDPHKDYWIRVNINGTTTDGLWESYLYSMLIHPDTNIVTKVSMTNPGNKEGRQTSVSFYQHILPPYDKSRYELVLSNLYHHTTKFDSLSVTLYSR